MPPNVEAHIGTEVSGEVVAAKVVGAATAVAIDHAIKPQIFSANACHHIGTEFLVSPPINSVEIVKNRAVRLNEAETGRGQVLVRAPCDFSAEANVMLEKDDPAEARVQAAAQ